MADVDGAEKSDTNDKARQDGSVSESSDREVSEAFGATGNTVGENATSGVNHDQGEQQQHEDDTSKPNGDVKHENGLNEKTDKPRSPVEIYDPSKHSPPVETLSPKGKRLQSTGENPDELTSENLLNDADKHQSELPRGGDDRLRTLRTGDLSVESYRKMKLELDQVRVELRLLSDRNTLLASENAKLRSKLVDNIKRRTCSSALTTLASGPTDSYRRSAADTRRAVSPLRTLTLHNFDYGSKREDFLSADSSRSASRASSDENEIALMHKTDASQLYTRTVLQHGNSLRDLSPKTSSFSSRYESTYTPRYSHYPTAVRYSSLAINEREREREREREQREYERERERRHALIRRIEHSRLLAVSPSRELRESWSASTSASASARKSAAYDSSTLARGWRQRPFAPSHYSEVRVGDDVKFTHRGAIGRARVLFVGHVMRDERVLIGLEVTDECALSVADSDGLLHGVRYFRTRPNRALFVPIDNVLLVL